jgi:hypothetical protein
MVVGFNKLSTVFINTIVPILFQSFGDNGR